MFFFSPSEDEYESVVFLPKGARNIEVVKRGKARHFIGTYRLLYFYDLLTTQSGLDSRTKAHNRWNVQVCRDLKYCIDKTILPN